MSLAALARTLEEVSTSVRAEQRTTWAAAEMASADVHDISVADLVRSADRIVDVLNQFKTTITEQRAVLERGLRPGALEHGEDGQTISFDRWSGLEQSMTELHDSLARAEQSQFGAIFRQLVLQKPLRTPDSDRLVLRKTEEVDEAEQAARLHIRSVLGMLDRLRSLIQGKTEESRGTRGGEPTPARPPSNASDDAIDYESERRRITARFAKTLARLGE